jgi:hypothetical protein
VVGDPVTPIRREASPKRAPAPRVDALSSADFQPDASSIDAFVW